MTGLISLLLLYRQVVKLLANCKALLKMQRAS